MFAPLALVLLLAQAPSSAPPEGRPDPKAKAQAQVLLRQGNKLHAKGDVRGALDKFKAAYAAFPSPKLLYTMGEAHRELGELVEALEAFQAFRKKAVKVPARTTAEVQSSITELQRALGQLRIISTPAGGVDVTVDARSIGTTPLPEALWIAPGTHEIAGRRDGFLPRTAATVVTAGATQEIRLKLDPIPPPRPPAPPPPPAPVARPLYRRPWFWGAVGAAVAAGVVTAFVVGRNGSPGGQ